MKLNQSLTLINHYHERGRGWELVSRILIMLMFFYPFKTVEMKLIIKVMSKIMSSAHLMSGVNPPGNLCRWVSLR